MDGNIEQQEEKAQEKEPPIPKKPILDRFSEMNADGLIEYFKSSGNFILKSLGERMEAENSSGGITNETFRTALRRIVTRVPGSGDTEKLLEKIRSNK